MDDPSELIAIKTPKECHFSEMTLNNQIKRRVKVKMVPGN